MIKYQLIVFLTILKFFHFAQPNINQCSIRKNEIIVKCDCANSELDIDNCLGQLKKNNETYIKSVSWIDCILRDNLNKSLKTIQHLDLLFLSKLISKLQIASFEGCPLKTFFTFNQQIFQLVPKVKELTFRNIRITNNPGAFKNAIELTKIDFFNGKLYRLPKNFFLGAINLKNLILVSSELFNLKVKAFEGLGNLRHLDLSSNFLSELRNGQLIGLKSLEVFILNLNRLNVLERDVFKDVPMLKKLLLDYNKLIQLDPTQFQFTARLNILSLKCNSLIQLDGDIFQNTTDLTDLDLSGNRFNLFDFPDQIFKKLMMLKKLDLSKNELVLSKCDFTAFSELKMLTNLNLSGNSITCLPKTKFKNKVQLKIMDMSNNQLSGDLKVEDLLGFGDQDLTINLQGNKISSLSFNAVRNVFIKNITIILRGNPVRCDCENNDMFRYSKNASMLVNINFDFGDLKCNDGDLQFSSNGMCPQENICPKECDCHTKASVASTIYVNCSQRNLEVVPKLKNFFQFSKVEVDLSGNKLTNGKHSSFDRTYENVTKLNLSNNKFKDIDYYWSPKKIIELNLDHNEFTDLNYEAVVFLINCPTLNSLTLSENPWKCECDSKGFERFLFDSLNTTKIYDFNKIFCQDGIHFSAKIQTCLSDQKTSDHLLISILVPVLVLLVIFCVFALLYLEYKRQIFVFLYTHKMCLCFISEELLDEDKKFDIFLCYSNKDMEFVINEVLPTLKKSYSVLHHEEQFKAGITIIKNILDAINESKRTIILLTQAFLDSSWCVYEFEMAYKEAVDKRRPKVIVVKCGDIEEDKMSVDIKVYLKTNTYLEWGRKDFWKQLHRAMPLPINGDNQGQECMEMV